jgi:SAM-dependent methyltransferase
MRDERRLAFGGVAEVYDLARPSYPSELVDDVVSGAPSIEALEVGAGTGKATVLFGARGVRVLALEPSGPMAALARRNCAAFPDVVLEEREFETFDSPAEEFGLLYSAQAWHWIAPEARYVRAHEVLCKGGLLAVFWNRARWQDSDLREAMRGAYERAAPGIDIGPMHPGHEARPQRWREREREVHEAVGFERAETRSYRWEEEYTTEQYLDLLRSHSSYAVLPDDQRQALLAEIGGVIEGAGGTLPVDYETQLFMAWRV